MEFQLEMDPTLTGWALFKKVDRRQGAAGAGAGRDDATGADWTSLYIQASGAQVPGRTS